MIPASPLPKHPLNCLVLYSLPLSLILPFSHLINLFHMTSVFFICFVWCFHILVSSPSVSHWDSKSTWLYTISQTHPMFSFPNVLRHAVPSVVYAFPPSLWVVTLPNGGTSHAGPSPWSLTWFPKPTMAYFPLKSIVVVCPTIYLLTSYAVFQRKSASHAIPY